MSVAISENVGTFQLSASTLSIVAEWGVTKISLLLVSGTVTYTGSMKLGSTSSSAITLTETPLTLSFDFPIDGFTIDATSGVVIIITGK